MNVVSIGPLVLAYDRLVVFAGLGLFIALAEWSSKRRGEPSLAAWAWNAATAGLLAARLGYVFSHWSVYSRDLASIFYVWQGGFSPWWGIAGGALYTLWFFRHSPRLLSATLLPLAAGLALSAGLWFLPQNRAGQLALPEVTLRDLSGSQVKPAEFAGRPVVINVWATWCPPCRRELPMLARAAADHPEAVFLFVDQGEPASKVASFLEERGLKIEHVLLDTSGSLARKLPIRGYPTTFFFNDQGKLVSSKTGEMNRAALEDLLKRVR
ncbi:prolipoprotein diacylglyceryl transferase family protein [Oceanithermus sp.]